MIWTDPPYNVNYQGKAGKIKNDNMSDDKFYHFLRAAFDNMAAVLIDGGAVYVAHADAGQLGMTFRAAFLDAGLKLASCLVWRKNRFVLSRSDYHWQHEPILYGWKPSGPHRWFGNRKQKTIQEIFGEDVLTMIDEQTYQLQLGSVSYLLTGDNIKVCEAETTVLRIDSPTKSKLHPTMKPVSLIARMLYNSSKSGDLVLDPFAGSGSTLIACEKHARRSASIELAPRFCDVIVQRWQDFTGREATLADDGRTFAEVSAARQ